MTPSTLRLHAVALAGGLVPPEDTVALLNKTAQALDDARVFARAILAALAMTDDHGRVVLGAGARKVIRERAEEILKE